MKCLGKRAKLFFHLIFLFVGIWLWLNGSSFVFAQQEGKLYCTDANNYGTAKAKVLRANLDGSNVELLVTPGGLNPRFIAIDIEGSRMYWTDVAAIKRANLDGSGVTAFIQSPGSSGLALDSANGKFYWTDIVENNIKRANLNDGTNIEVVLGGLKTPHCIALDLSEGKMYWTNMDWVSWMPSIQRANLDGTSVETLVTQGVEWPHGLALDLADEKIYWTESYRIRRANLDGSNVEILTLPYTYNYRGLALDIQANKVYWTSLWPGKIVRSDLNGNNIEELITTGLDTPWGLALIPEPIIEVTIDIKPGSYPNSINLGSNGVVSVAILGSDNFDATTVDPITVALAGAEVRLKGNGNPMASFQDVNEDGLLDIIIQVETSALELSSTAIIATLTGKTKGGNSFRGEDTVRVVR